MMRLSIVDANRIAAWVNAFIDDGSDSTLMRKGIATSLKGFGVHQILTV